MKEAIFQLIGAVSDSVTIVAGIKSIATDISKLYTSVTNNQLIFGNKKNLSIFAKHVHSKWKDGGFCRYVKSAKDGKLYLDVPLWLNITNNGNKDRIFRDVNIYAYNNGNKVARFRQVQSITTKDDDGNSEKIILGENESYNLHVLTHESKQFNLEFFLSSREYNGAFDELYLEYYDEKNKCHSSHLLKINTLWRQEEIPIPNEWIEIK